MRSDKGIYNSSLYVFIFCEIGLLEQENKTEQKWSVFYDNLLHRNCTRMYNRQTKCHTGMLVCHLETAEHLLFINESIAFWLSSRYYQALNNNHWHILFYILDYYFFSAQWILNIYIYEYLLNLLKTSVLKCKDHCVFTLEDKCPHLWRQLSSNQFAERGYSYWIQKFSKFFLIMFLKHPDFHLLVKILFLNGHTTHVYASWAQVKCSFLAI